MPLVLENSNLFPQEVFIKKYIYIFIPFWRHLTFLFPLRMTFLEKMTCTLYFHLLQAIFSLIVLPLQVTTAVQVVTNKIKLIISGMLFLPFIFFAVLNLCTIQRFLYTHVVWDSVTLAHPPRSPPWSSSLPSSPHSSLLGSTCFFSCVLVFGCISPQTTSPVSIHLTSESLSLRPTSLFRTCLTSQNALVASTAWMPW